jgi:uncharacterized protein
VMADQSVKLALLLTEALPLLRNVGTNADRLHQLTGEMIAIEDDSDRIHDEGLKELIKKGKTDPMSFIVGSEIYSHLEKVADRFEGVAHTISGIVIEHV